MNKFKQIILFYFNIILLAAINGDEIKKPPILKIPDGLIQGEYMLSRNGKQFIGYEGIPYAKPPIGKLRFEAPEPNDPWLGVLQSRFPNLCIQLPMGSNKSEGQEDCLYLMVYTPKDVDPNAKLNVIVNIHGGAFMVGSGLIAGPKYLLDRDDFIYVNLHYRVGPFGFLSTENEIVPGNNGLKDQNLVLKWVQKNIKYFGGDPTKVTLMGCSAGGVSVHLHLLSPLSQGLFQNAFLLSGTGFNPWTRSENNLERAKHLAGLVGCDDNDGLQSMIDCMKSRPSTQISEQVIHYREFSYLPLSPFGIVVEHGGKQPFINKDLREIIESNEIADVPILFSFNQNEGLIPALEFIRNDHYFNDLNNNWNKLAPVVLDIVDTVQPEFKNDVINKVKQFYMQGKDFNKENFQDLVDMFSDRYFIAGIIETIQLQSKVNKSPVYLYQFNYRGHFSFTNYFGLKENLGACHGDDQFYMFSPPIELNKSEDPMINTMLNMLVTFAKTGVPKLNDIEWKPACFSKSSDTINYLSIYSPNDIKSYSNNSIGHLEFWKSLPINE